MIICLSNIGKCNVGPYLGLRLHFTCDIPSTYPTTSPQIVIDTPVRHPNVLGSYICADILKSQTLKASGYIGGYVCSNVSLLLIYLFSGKLHV